MKDYSIEITVTIPITARNEEQAQERAELLLDCIKFEGPKRAKWYGDVDFGDPAVEEA